MLSALPAASPAASLPAQTRRIYPRSAYPAATCQAGQAGIRPSAVCTLPPSRLRAVRHNREPRRGEGVCGSSAGPLP